MHLELPYYGAHTIKISENAFNLAHSLTTSYIGVECRRLLTRSIKTFVNGRFGNFTSKSIVLLNRA